jgi:hypothetical protein
MTPALDCDKRANRCLYRAVSAKDKEVKQLLRDMAQAWRTMARQIERMDALRARRVMGGHG